MTPSSVPADEPEQGALTRRKFLAGMAIGSAAGAGLWWSARRGSEVATLDPTSTTAAQSTTTGQPSTTGVAAGPPTTSEGVEEVASDLLTAAPIDQRVLVFIELEGGNDGPSTLIPYADGAYYDLRPNLALPADAVLPLDDEVGLNPNLSRLASRQLAVVEGVGPVDGVLSHFEMVERWERGDMRGSNGFRTGFLARVADELDDGSATIGLSVDGFTPRFSNVTASTLSLNNMNSLRVLTREEWIFPAYRAAVSSFSGGPMTTTMAESWQHLFEIGRALPTEIEPPDNESAIVKEGRQLGRQLATAAELIKADVGIRVVHARLGGFDTHKGHPYKHESLMQQVDIAVDGFLAAIDDAGLSDRVLVATSSEFGRRARENGNGLDHGSASTMLLWGPVLPGRHGEPSPLNDLDGKGNLKTMVPFDAYLATLAQGWLGVDASSVLPGTPELLQLFNES